MCVGGAFSSICVRYRAFPQAHSSERRHHVYDDDGELHLRHVNPAETPHVYCTFTRTQTGAGGHSQAKAHGPRHVGLPVGAEEHEHPHETAEEHPVRVLAYPAGNAGSHGNKYWRQRNGTGDERGCRGCVSPKTAAREHLWRRRRSRGQRSPPGRRSCWSSSTASRRWRLETGRRRGRTRSARRPMMEPGC